MASAKLHARCIGKLRCARHASGVAALNNPTLRLLRAVGAARCLGVEVDDAIEMAEQVEV